MIDNKLLREQLDEIVTALNKKHYNLDVTTYQKLEAKRRDLQQQTESFQAQRNAMAKRIGMAKAKGEATEDLFKEAQLLGDKMGSIEKDLKEHQASMQSFLAQIPNTPHHTTPTGRNETDNITVKTWGTIPTFDFPVKDHVALTESSGQMDFHTASQLSCSRFVVLKNDIALLNRALSQFMLNTHTQRFGYTEVNTPVLANADTLYGTGQLPKFKDDQFWTDDDKHLALIPTAEVTLTNLVRDTQLRIDDLPLKLCAHSLCFRKEAGSYGKDTRGILRMHQFEKIELVQICHPDSSYEQLENLTSHAEFILEALELPYRKVALCGGDLGFSAAKTYDLEVWVPSQQCYREISSCSNTESFQARRINAKIKTDKKSILAHCLNGSGLAVGRTLLAVLENYQQADGSILIPQVLRPYMHERTHILTS